MKKENFFSQIGKIGATYKRIIEWKSMADNEKDPIKRFIFRWIAFNGFYSAAYSFIKSQKDAENHSDDKKIKFYCNAFINGDNNLYNKICTQEIIDLMVKNIHIQKGKIKDYLRILKTSKDAEDAAKILIKMAYKIRCRLFHGEKNPFLEVNKKVIEAADQVIEPILQNFENRCNSKII